MLEPKNKIQSIKKILSESEINLKHISSSPALDTEVLLRHVLKKNKAFLFTHPEYILKKSEQKKFEHMLARRKQHEPIAYILGKKEFYGRNFFVDKTVLIPRPRTEHLIEEALKEPSDIYLDVGTGSGCIIITLCKEIFKNHPKKKHLPIFLATDISNKSLKIAKKNAKLHKVKKYIQFYKGDLLLPTVVADNYSPLQNICIIANLPYISPKKYKTLAKDIRYYEPRLALLAKDHGLFYYKKLFRKIKKKSFIENFSKIRCIFEIESNQKRFFGAMPCSTPQEGIISIQVVPRRSDISFPAKS